MVADKKRGGNSSPAIFKRLTAALSGVALGVVSCLSWYDPVPVHADFGNLADTVDYITSAEGAEASLLSSNPVAPCLLLFYVISQVDEYNDYVYDASHPVPGVFSGTYYDENGNKKIGVGFTYDTYLNTSTVDTVYMPLLYGADIDVKFRAKPTLTYKVIYDSSSNSLVIRSNDANNNVLLQSYSNDYYYGSVGGYNCSGTNIIANRDIFPYQRHLNTCFAAGYAPNNGVFSGTPNLYYPPAGLMSPSDIDRYLQNEFREYVIMYYPDFIYLLPEPEPEPPQYSTDDIIPGIPKDWTIINPELPTSPHLDLTIPEGDFQAIDPGDTFTGFASGVGFWWAMVNTILNTFQIKTLALALLAVAVAIFAMYKIGG